MSVCTTSATPTGQALLRVKMRAAHSRRTEAAGWLVSRCGSDHPAGASGLGWLRAGVGGLTALERPGSSLRCRWFTSVGKGTESR